MNASLAVGLFDNPWIIALLVIVSALADWMSKRRQGKQEGNPPGDDAPAPSPGKPPGEFNLEETLRRLMGEVPPAELRPPIPREAQTELPAAPDWQEEEEPFQSARQIVLPLRPPAITALQARIMTSAVVEQEAQAARRFEQLSEQGRHPATVTGHRHRQGYQSGSGRRTASRWRHRQGVRQAFVASMIFAQPKSLEP